MLCYVMRKLHAELEASHLVERAERCVHNASRMIDDDCVSEGHGFSGSLGQKCELQCLLCVS